MRIGRPAVLWGAAVLAALTFVAVRTRPDFFDLWVYRDAERWWAAGNPLYSYVQPDSAQHTLGFTYPRPAPSCCAPWRGCPAAARRPSWCW